jgi:hypothetical protein
MRYFVVTYIQKADGKWDESVQIAGKTLTNKLNVSANVILDFKEKVVVKARLEQALVRDFDLIRDYFYKIYPKVIDQLEKENKKEDPASTEPSSADNES